MIYGIDFGNLKSRVAVTRRGGVDVILNELSQRDSSSFVSYGEKERYIGEKGFDQAIRNQKNTVSNLKRFLAMKSDSSILEYEKKFVSCNTVCGEGGDVEFEVSYLGETKRFRPQQTLAAFLRKLHSFVELDSISNGGPAMKGTDCVISCPVYYSVSQRKALLQAAEIAGLNCMALMNESTACALDYGIFKSSSFPDFEGGKPGTVVLFADVGHSATTISVTSFWKGSMRVLGTVYDTNLGTREIDNILLHHFRNEILAKYKVDVYENSKAKFRLLQAIEKMKVMLSANPVSNLNVECLMNDIDVSFPNIKREDLEEMIAERFLVPLEKLCVEATKLEGVNLSETPIEVIGGGSRMPAVKKIIAKVFGVAPSTTLVATESIAKGCAILAAMLSPKFKVKEYAIQERVLRSIHVGYLSQNPSKPRLVDFLPAEAVNYHVPVFKKGETYPKSLDLTFDRSDPFDLYYFYCDSDSEEVVSRLGQGAQLIGHVKVGGIVKPQVPPQATQLGSLKVKVRFRLSFTGLMDVESASVVQDFEEEVPEATGVEGTEESKTETKKTRKREAKLEATQELKHTLAMSPELVLKATKDESDMARRDKLVFETLEAKNALEGYMYDYSSKLGESGELNAFVARESLEAFSKLSKEYEEWLFGEGEDSNIEEYSSRLKTLKEIAEPALKRYYDAEQLPGEVQSAKRELEARASKLKTIVESDPESGWVSATEVEKVRGEIEEFSTWLESELLKAQSSPKHVDGTLTTRAIRSKLSALGLSVDPVLNRPKPLPKPQPVPPEATPEAETVPPSAEKTTEVD